MSTARNFWDRQASGTERGRDGEKQQPIQWLSTSPRWRRSWFEVLRSGASTSKPKARTRRSGASQSNQTECLTGSADQAQRMKLDDEDIQRIAERIVELLGERERKSPVERAADAPAGLVDAATLAQALGVDRDWVYAHAKQLGAIRLGGPQGRLRFDLAKVTSQLAPAPLDRPRAPIRAPRRACTTAPARPRIGQQKSMAGRRANAPGPTPGDGPDVL